MIGSGGLTPAVLLEIEANLNSHELIKVRVLGDDRVARDTLISEICETAGATPVQQIGKVLVIYRPKPPQAGTNKKRRPGRKQPRRTKRSYQNG